MNEIRDTSGALDGTGMRFALVAARFNSRIVDRLVDGAVDCLLRHGVAAGDLEVVRVPGAWELPLALQALAAGGRFQGLVALGAVIRGETPHFDYVAAEASRGIARAGTEHRVPVGFGLLTTDTSAQAEERAGGKAGNKGWDAALAALEMASLLARLRDADGETGGGPGGGGH
ncbi:MAG TPA: 6,7-dimethyl-8-ribityllumazine synthase [Thermoanaerobaculia bacterium]|nr:6,7-dimethyl-8-ribityllumazine synthase [Thermoanaerobaculia bacterium]